MSTPRIVLAALAAGLALDSLRTQALAQYIGPTPYLQASDSSLLGPAFAYFHLENFEDGLINTPGLSASGGVVNNPGLFTDSVDADDGLIDGSGTGGRSYFSQNSLPSITFFFSQSALDNYPTHAGLVWTDVGDVLNGLPGFGNIRVEAFDGGGLSLGAFGVNGLGDGSAQGGTAEDRFVGVVNAGGISRISITHPNSFDWEVDHVQYGYVPTPGVLALLGVGGLSATRRRR